MCKPPIPYPIYRVAGNCDVMLSGQNCAYLMERGLGMLDRIRFIGNRYKVIADPPGNCAAAAPRR